MSGITRINIVSNWNDWRTELARRHSEQADAIYRGVFNIADGKQEIKVSKDEAMARYDWKEGIDVILEMKSGARMTLQEKYLTFDKSTITFEETKTSGEKGAWYYCTAQYYFVGYTREYWDWRNRQTYPNPITAFQDWILIDLPAIHRESERNNIMWKYQVNGKDGRKSTFRYINFLDVPDCCIIGKAQR